MIEALGFGLPIVAADTAINREVCGDGALYYAPLEALAAANQINSALGKDVRKRLIEAGNQSFMEFDWGWER